MFHSHLGHRAVAEPLQKPLAITQVDFMAGILELY